MVNCKTLTVLNKRMFSGCNGLFWDIPIQLERKYVLYKVRFDTHSLSLLNYIL